jgi:hypothetical protein
MHGDLRHVLVVSLLQYQQLASSYPHRGGGGALSGEHKSGEHSSNDNFGHSFFAFPGASSSHRRATLLAKAGWCH